MTNEMLIRRLEIEAIKAEYSYPRITIEGGMVRLYATSVGYDGERRERLVKFLGLTKDGFQRLVAVLRKE